MGDLLAEAWRCYMVSLTPDISTRRYCSTMITRAFKCAFPFTIPILAGFWFLGITYGIYASSCGFPFWYPMLMGMTIFGGSLEFIAVSMLLAPYAPLTAFVMAVMIQARHLFYGISMLDKFKGLGWKRLYLIFGMCDETFSINYTADIPEDVDRGWFYLIVTFLNQIYWVSGAAIGGILGDFIQFNTDGVDFVMTAMFVVIFLEQWRKQENHWNAWIGAAASIVCLLLCGPDNFLIPAMICILAVLTLLRRPLERRFTEAVDSDQVSGTLSDPDQRLFVQYQEEEVSDR